MRAFTLYRGVVIMTGLAGGFYFRAAGVMVCRVDLVDLKREIDALFV